MLQTERYKMKRPLVRLVFIFRLISLGAIAAGAWAFIQVPFTKLPTALAVRRIEEQYIRHDLTREERAGFDFYKGWILGNNKQLTGCWWNARLIAVIGMPLMGILLLLSTLRR